MNLHCKLSKWQMHAMLSLGGLHANKCKSGTKIVQVYNNELHLIEPPIITLLLFSTCNFELQKR